MNVFLDSDVLISSLRDPDFEFPDIASYFISKKSLYEFTYMLKNKLTDKVFILKHIKGHDDGTAILNLPQLQGPLIFTSDILQEFWPGAKVSTAYQYPQGFKKCYPHRECRIRDLILHVAVFKYRVKL